MIRIIKALLAYRREVIDSGYTWNYQSPHPHAEKMRRK